MLKNVGSNWLMMVLTIVTTFILMPFNLNALGHEQYGVWIIISSLIGYLAFLHLGVPTASVREMTQAIALGDDSRLNQVIASCFGTYLIIGGIALLVGVPLYFFLTGFYRINPAFLSEARLAFLLGLSQIALSYVAIMPQAILVSFQAFVAKNVHLALVLICRFCINIALVLYYPSILMLGIVMLAATIIEFFLLWSYVLRKYPQIRPRPRDFSFTTIRGMSGFSAYIFLLAIGMYVAYLTSPLIVGYALSAADVPTMAVPLNLMQILMQFISGIALVLIPVATNLQSTGHSAELREVYFKWTKISLGLSVCAGLFLFLFGPAFLKFWIGRSFPDEAGLVLQILVASYVLYLPAVGAAVPVLTGLGLAKAPALATLSFAAVSFGLSLALVGPLGVVGVAFALAACNIALSVALVLQACRVLDISLSAYLASTLPHAALASASALLALGAWGDLFQPSGLFGLGVAGTLTVIVCALLWSEFVLRDDPHVQLPRLSQVVRG